MLTDLVAAFFGHFLFGAILSILGLSVAFWLGVTFHFARSAIRWLAMLTPALQAEPFRHVRCHAS